MLDAGVHVVLRRSLDWWMIWLTAKGQPFGSSARAPWMRSSQTSSSSLGRALRAETSR